jgi:hypothetical protein
MLQTGVPVPQLTVETFQITLIIDAGRFTYTGDFTDARGGFAR